MLKLFCKLTISRVCGGPFGKLAFLLQVDSPLIFGKGAFYEKEYYSIIHNLYFYSIYDSIFWLYHCK
jgi:hypothetical protein